MILYVNEQPEAPRAFLDDEFGDEQVVEWLRDIAALEQRLDDDAADDPPEVVVIGPDIALELGLKAAEKLSDSRPDIGVVLLVQRLEADDLRRALRAGVRDVLDDRRLPGELRETVARVRERTTNLRASAGPPREGRLVVVFSSKGGSGKSFIASNLAATLAARNGTSVGLVDLSLTSGDLAIMLQLVPAWSIADAIIGGDRLDVEALRGYLTQHGSGVHLLAAPADPAVAETITADAVVHVLQLLRSMFPVTIIDGPSFFSEPLLAAIDVADEFVLVSTLDVPAVKNLKLALETLNLLHVRRDRIRVVLNRANTTVGLRVSEVERSLETSIDVRIPSSRDVPVAVNQGVTMATLKRRSPVHAAIEQLADLVMPPTEPKRPARGRRRAWLGRQ